MAEDEVQQCRKCKAALPAAAFTSESGREAGICNPCLRMLRVYENAANNTFWLLDEDVMEGDAGWRAGRRLDGYFWGWLCPHAHPSQAEASNCPAKESLSLLGPATKPEGGAAEVLPWRAPGPGMEE